MKLTTIVLGTVLSFGSAATAKTVYPIDWCYSAGNNAWVAQNMSNEGASVREAFAGLKLTTGTGSYMKLMRYVVNLVMTTPGSKFESPDIVEQVTENMCLNGEFDWLLRQ